VTSGYLGLGSNLGERRGSLQAAADALTRTGTAVLASSSVYETDPVGEVSDQPSFLNACLRVETELAPTALLAQVKAIERELGRPPGGPRHGPRPIDIDLLLLGDTVHRGGGLELPHPALAERRFVLIPLLELDLSLSVPGLGRAAELLERLPTDAGVRHAGPPLSVGACSPDGRPQASDASHAGGSTPAGTLPANGGK